MEGTRKQILIIASTYPIPGVKGIPPFVQTLALSVSQYFTLKVHTLGRSKRLPKSHLAIENEILVHRTLRKSNNESSGLIYHFRPRSILKESYLLLRFVISLVRDLRINSYDLIHVHWAAPLPPILRALRVLRIIPRELSYIVSMHGADVLLLEGKLARFIKYGLRGAEVWTTVNTRDLELVRAKLSENGSRSMVLPMPVNPIFRSGRSDRSAPLEGRIRLLYVGRLVRKKGASEFLRAVERLRGSHEYEVVIVGSGPLEGALKDRFGHLAQFVGPRSPDEIVKMMGSDTIFVAPFIDQPKDREGLPVTILEAASAGIPIVTTPIAGIRDLIEAGMEFEVCNDPGNSDDLASSIESCARSLRSAGPELSFHIAANQKIVMEQFDENSKHLIHEIYSYYSFSSTGDETVE